MALTASMTATAFSTLEEKRKPLGPRYGTAGLQEHNLRHIEPHKLFTVAYFGVVLICKYGLQDCQSSITT